MSIAYPIRPRASVRALVRLHGMVATLALAVILSGFLLAPWPGWACGWAGDGDNEEVDAVVIGADGRPLSEGDRSTVDPVALNRTGDRYRKGMSVTRDAAEAALWYRRAAERGHAAAQNNLAALYESGQGVVKDAAEAARWFRMAAAQGEPHAQHSLGVLYRDGRGVGHDPAAAKWIGAAARQGHGGAFVDLGVLYWEGLGAMRDDTQAYMWWALAAASGDKMGARLCAVAEKTMAPDKIAEAKNQARQWKPITQ